MSNPGMQSGSGLHNKVRVETMCGYGKYWFLYSHMQSSHLNSFDVQPQSNDIRCILFLVLFVYVMFD